MSLRPSGRDYPYPVAPLGVRHVQEHATGYTQQINALLSVVFPIVDLLDREWIIKRLDRLVE